MDAKEISVVAAVVAVVLSELDGNFTIKEQKMAPKAFPSGQCRFTIDWLWQKVC